MESEKDEISLVMKGGDLSAHKLRVLREESGKQTTYAVSKAGGEVVENHLWIVFGRLFASSLKNKEFSKRSAQMNLRRPAWEPSGSLKFSHFLIRPT